MKSCTLITFGYIYHSIVSRLTTSVTGSRNLEIDYCFDELEQTFIHPTNVAFDRYLLLTRKQHRGERMEQFQSALRSLAEHCQLADLEDELLRDIFTANMIDQETQKELLKTTLTPEKDLEVAVSIKLGIRSQLAIQARQPSDASANPSDEMNQSWKFPARVTAD